MAKKDQQQEAPVQGATAEQATLATSTEAPVEAANAIVHRFLPREVMEEIMREIEADEQQERLQRDRRRHPWKSDFLPKCEGLALLPIGGRKIPVDPETGGGLKGWPHQAFTIEELSKPNGWIKALGYRPGPDSGHILCVDVDGATAVAWLKERGLEPEDAGWCTMRGVDRLKVHFSLSEEQRDQLQVGKFVLTIKEHGGRGGEKGEQIELFNGSGQCVVAGRHPSGALYSNAGSPETVTAPNDAWMAALQEIVAKGKKPSQTKGQEPDERYQCGPDKPCPICGRTHSTICTIWISAEEDGSTRRGVNCFHGQTLAPPKTIDLGGMFKGEQPLQRGDEITGADGKQWAFVREGRSSLGSFSVFREHRPLTKAKGRKGTPSCASGGVLESGHFTILGWADGQREEIYYRAARTKQIAAFKCRARTELLRLAPLEHWIAVYGREQENQPRQAPLDWDAAMSDVICEADRCGVFDRGLLRGHGVWLDRGRAVWHLGDRLEVDGEMRGLDEIEGENQYERLPALQVDPGVVPLQNNEGVAVLNVLQEMGWASPVDALHLAGWLVLANVGGALPKRPGLQLTSSSGTGKSDCVTEVILPLLAGLAEYSSTSSEAGMRQKLKASSTPAVIDESEQENAKKREAQLRLVRLSYDGVPQLMGTPSGEARNFVMRSSLCLVGINATIPNVADRNRIVVISRQQIPLEQWEPLARRRDELITRETGERLMRRTVSNLHTLLGNVKTFGRVVSRRYGGRAGDTYGALLAGAHHLISLEEVDEAQAQRWVEAQRWELTGEALASSAAKNEAEQCLEHLLKHELPFKGASSLDGGSLTDSHGMVSIREMVDYLSTKADTPARLWGEDSCKTAERVLGRYGLKVDLERGFLVHTGGKGRLSDIYANTRWANGAFKDRLLDLPGVVRVPSAVRMQVLGPVKSIIALPFPLISEKVVPEKFPTGNIGKSEEPSQNLRSGEVPPNTHGTLKGKSFAVDDWGDWEEDGW